MDQKSIYEPPTTEGCADTQVEVAVPQLTEMEILALRQLLLHMKNIAKVCPIAQRALSTR